MEITLKNISRYYKNRLAVDNFTWTINFDNNNIFALIGPNGAGKTTILKIISGIYYFESGEIHSSSQDKYYPIWARDNIS